MIDIPQWRASIGAFNSVYQSKKSVTITISEDYYSITVSDTYRYKIFIWSASLYCVMYVSFSALCLVLSGDIETNPGPFHRLCPVQNVMNIFILRKKFAHVVTSFVKNLETLQK